MQPHVFCGPEFLLAIPEEQLQSILQTSESKTDDLNYGSKASNKSSNRSNRVQEAILLQWQADIYSICTPRTRRALHNKKSTTTESLLNKTIENKMTKRDANPFIDAGTSIASGLKLIAELNTGPIPSSSTQLQFVEIKYDGEMSSEERASFQHSIKLAEQQQQQQQQQQQSKEVNKSKEKQELSEESKVENMSNDDNNYGRHQSLSLSETATSNASSTNYKFVYLMLYLTDSRVAAEVYMLLLRNVYLSLSGQCRMYNFFRLTSRAAPVVLSELLHRRELLRSHFNLDADLWSALHDAITPELRNEILSEGVSSSSTSNYNSLSSSNTTSTINMSGRLLTAAEEHHNAIKRVLHYCENHVQYAAVLDENEEASPFLCAFYFANELQITCGDLLQFFIRHPRRVIRALALFLARYLLPPEELPVVFYGALFDEVVIACSADLQLTMSVKEIAHALLRQDEFNEAWLPALHKYWMESIIVRDIDDMTALYNEHQRHKRALDNNEATVSATTKINNKAIQEVKGSGKGIAGTLGFRSIKDLARHAEMHQEQMFVPQRMVTLVARQRGIYDDDEYIDSSSDNIKNKLFDTNNKFTNTSVENDINNDAQLEEEEETRDFFDEYLIDIEVIKAESTSSNTVLPGLQSARHNFTNLDGSHKRSRDDLSSLPHLQHEQIQKRQSSQGQLASNALRNKNDTDNKVTTNEQVNVFRKGERLILSLLGRTTPIRPSDPVYLEF